MKYLIVGLGNPGVEYKNSRHNLGRTILEKFADRNADKFLEWENNKKIKALYTKGKIGKNKVELLMPETFMNKSGLSLKSFALSEKKAEGLIVIYDDLDLPFGSFKISFNKGSGGHKGLESIIKTIKTKKFVRIRVGISPITPSGKIKKPKNEKAVLGLIMKNFNKSEQKIIDNFSEKISQAIILILEKGVVKAMNKYN